MSSYQFPPSSPLAHADASEDAFDAFRKPSKQYQAKNQVNDDSRGRYPTPNPSSSTGRSSSPARYDQIDIQAESTQQQHDAKSATRQVTFSIPEPTPSLSVNRDFNILNPDKNVLRIPLLSHKSNVIVGRSSKLCDFHFNTADKTVSRTHLDIHYTQDTINLRCLGYNGCAMRIPQSCHVYASKSNRRHFILTKSNQPLDSTQLNFTPRTIKLDHDHTEFAVNRGESVELPRMNNIMIEIRNNVALINPLDDEAELTDEEIPVLIQNSSEPISKPNKDAYAKVTPQLVQKSTFTPLRPTQGMPNPFTPPAKSVFDITPEEPTPSKQTEKQCEAQTKPQQAKANKPKSSLKRDISNSNPKQETTEFMSRPHSFTFPPRVTSTAEFNKSFRIFEDRPTDVRNIPSTPNSLPQRPSNSLSDKTNSYNTIAAPKRKASSEEPPQLRKHQPQHSHSLSSTQQQHHYPQQQQVPFKKRKQRSSENLQKVEIDQSCIASIPNVEEINNILVNHLAFSRLSSTPASFLNTISAVVSQISLKQLRVLLHNCKCIGVIYRQGKDAAGKPLEEEYYYMPEHDDDVERPKLVASIRGHGGLRSCRRTHKQYYWKKPAPIKK